MWASFSFLYSSEDRVRNDIEFQGLQGAFTSFIFSLQLMVGTKGNWQNTIVSGPTWKLPFVEGELKFVPKTF